MNMVDFQAFTTKFSAKTNVLFTKAGVSIAFNPHTTVTPPQIHEVNAIWDTGATCTVITKPLAQRVGLIPTGKTNISGVNHTTLENTYIVNVYLPNKVCMGFMKIAEVDALTGGAEMLIGMDIIGAGDFSVYTEDNKTVMSYRLPSIGGMDFVKEAEKLKTNREVLQRINEQREVNIQRKKIKKKRKKERLNKKRGRKANKKR